MEDKAGNDNYEKELDSENSEVELLNLGEATKKEKNKKPTAVVVAGGALAVLLKFKGILLLFLGKLKFIFIFLKLGKFAATFGSMFLMIAVEARRMGLSVAIGFVMLLMIHELGHYLMAKKSGLNVSMPIFIPFVGAFVSMKDMPKNVDVEAKVAIAGPILGSVASFACWGAYAMTGIKPLLLLAYFGLMLNLFNLVPINPLDGGRVVSCLSPKVWIFGIILMGAAVILTRSPMVIMILILGVIQTISYWRNPDKSYYDLEIEKRILYGGTYFGLVIMLGASLYEIYKIYGFERLS